MGEEFSNAKRAGILNAGVGMLVEMRDAVAELDALKISEKEFGDRVKQLEKDIAAKEKAREAEKNSLTSQRQNEIEKSYDEQIDKTKAQIKTVLSKRGKEKDDQVKRRMNVETAGMREEIRAYKQDVKGIFSKNGISRIFNTEYFFTMFMPDGIGDFFVIFLSIVVTLALPLVIYFFGLKEDMQTGWWLAVLYVGIIAIVGGIYTLIYKGVKNTHLEALGEAKKVRDKIKFSNKMINKTEKNIRKDNDESGYGLEKFDEEIKDCESELDRLIIQKKTALTTFENVTKNDILRTVDEKYKPDLEALKRQNEYAVEDLRDTDAKVKALSLDISNKYAAYIGQDKLNVQTLDTLIEIMNGGDASTVQQALDVYKMNQERM